MVRTFFIVFWFVVKNGLTDLSSASYLSGIALSFILCIALVNWRNEYNYLNVDSMSIKEIPKVFIAIWFSSDLSPVK